MQSAVMYWIILNTLLSLCILLNDQSNDFANMMSSSHAIQIFLEVLQLSGGRSVWVLVLKARHITS